LDIISSNTKNVYFFMFQRKDILSIILYRELGNN
jgi:hypothetical protein